MWDAWRPTGRHGAQAFPTPWVTNVHRDSCRLEVAVARHRCSTQLLSLGRFPSSLCNRPSSSRATLQ